MSIIMVGLPFLNSSMKKIIKIPLIFNIEKWLMKFRIALCLTIRRITNKTTGIPLLRVLICPRESKTVLLEFPNKYISFKLFELSTSLFPRMFLSWFRLNIKWIYRVSHIEICFLNCFWKVKGSIILLNYTANVLSAESTDVCLRTKSQDN